MYEKPENETALSFFFILHLIIFNIIFDKLFDFVQFRYRGILISQDFRLCHAFHFPENILIIY